MKAKALKPMHPTVLAPVQRWVRLFASIAKLNAEYGDSQIHNNLEELAKALNTLLYRVRMLFSKPIQGHVFHILNLHYITDYLSTASKAPVKTLLSSEMLPANSGGLGTDVMDIYESFDQNLKLCQRQYKGECLGSHMPDVFRYTSIAEKLRTSAAVTEHESKQLGDIGLVQVWSCPRLVFEISKTASACFRANKRNLTDISLSCTSHCIVAFISANDEIPSW